MNDSGNRRHAQRRHVCANRQISAPETTVIRLVLDNSSAHISKETRRYLASRPQRFVFVFTPTHGSWLNLIEVLFSKLTRSLLRGIRVASKTELIERLHQYFRELNEEPVVFRWKYKMDEVHIVKLLTEP